MLQAILILVVFAVFAVLMMTRRISTLLALLTMGILIALIGGIKVYPFDAKDGLIVDTLAGGVVRMAAAYTAVMFGAWMGQVLNQTGISKDIIRRAAELAGDKPLAVAIVLAIVTALLFTNLAGLGSVIMVGTIVLPILMTVGIKPLTAGAIYLLAFAAGLPVNLANLKTYATLANVPVASLQNFAVIQLVVTSVIALLAITWELRRPQKAWAATDTGKMKEELAKIKHVPVYSLIAPLIPLVLVFFFKWDVIASFMVGILYAALTVDVRKSLAVMTKAAHDGLTDGAPAILLMVALGVLLKAIAVPGVSAAMQGFLKAIIPGNRWLYMIFFAVLAPLAIYRGPLNMWGLGGGIVGLIIKSGILPAPAAMAAFMSTERVQSVGDPTNTQNVWTADFTKVDVNQLSLKLLPYMWVVAAISAIIAGLVYVA
jgi:Mg2+/citrate symporter